MTANLLPKKNKSWGYAGLPVAFPESDKAGQMELFEEERILQQGHTYQIYIWSKSMFSK